MRVSVCIPARDHARFLGDAIASALAQDVDGLELLVHDDASADATADVVAGFSDPRLRYARHRAPVGVTRVRDGLVAAARAPLVAWLDADDAWLAGTLARRVELLEADRRIALVHGAAKVVDEGGRRLPDWPAPFARDTIEPPGRALRNLLAGNEIVTSTVVMRRGACAAGLPARASGSDWALWLRAALRGDVAYLAAPVACYRRHAASISHATAAATRLRCDVAVAVDLLRRERAARSRDTVRIARAALAAKALARAGELAVQDRRSASLGAVALAVALDPAAVAPQAARLARATAVGDLHGCMRADRALRTRLAGRLAGTRRGERIGAQARVDPAWQATLARAAATLRRVVPARACVATVTKWDPTLLELSGRRGRNFPDRRALPGGYPRDGAAAVAHLDEQRCDGVSHLAFTSASMWWLEHYPELAARLGAPLHRDADLAVFELR